MDAVLGAEERDRPVRIESVSGVGRPVRVGVKPGEQVAGPPQEAVISRGAAERRVRHLLEQPHRVLDDEVEASGIDLTKQLVPVGLPRPSIVVSDPCKRRERFGQPLGQFSGRALHVGSPVIASVHARDYRRSARCLRLACGPAALCSDSPNSAGWSSLARAAHAERAETRGTDHRANLAAMPGPPPEIDACRLGLLAFGDSITNGGGELQMGIALQSWALWTARGLGLPYTPYAADGATATDVTGEQIPAFERFNATPDARYQLGCCYVGTNDLRRPAWDPAAFEGQLDTALRFVRERCDRLLTATIPLRLGRPRTGAAKVEEANEAIERVAAAHGGLVLDLREFGARNLIMVDRVHPTALGQIAIAERALALLERDGMTVRAHPSLMIAEQLEWFRPSRVQRLRSDLRYAWRHVRVDIRAALIERGVLS